MAAGIRPKSGVPTDADRMQSGPTGSRPGKGRARAAGAVRGGTSGYGPHVGILPTFRRGPVVVFLPLERKTTAAVGRCIFSSKNSYLCGP